MVQPVVEVRLMKRAKAKEAAMSQPTKPTSAQSNSQEQPTGTDQALPETELENVSGGKVVIHDLTITKPIDKSSPTLG
jgi:type VI protein secretion system component Hcp